MEYSYVAMRHKNIPFSEWEAIVAGEATRNEVVFPCLDDTFGGVSAMVFQGYTLKCDAVLAKGGFEVVEELVINYVEGRRVAVFQ